jgi:hypothetical protein
MCGELHHAQRTAQLQGARQGWVRLLGLLLQVSALQGDAVQLPLDLRQRLSEGLLEALR